MKKSLYTYLFCKNNLFYLYNSQTGLFTNISESLYEVLYNNDFNSLDPMTLNNLKNKKIIVEDHQLYDYYNSCRLEYLASIGNHEKLSLIIVPTTGCNFECPYCFEGKKDNNRMTHGVIDALIFFINGYKGVKELHITWYGGEPLVAFDIIKVLTNRIKAECTIELISYSMITNGYLINDEVAMFMKTHNFKYIQITFDGIELNHNRTRYLKGTKTPSFKKILQNVDRLVKKMPSYSRIALRININRNNSSDYIAMYKLFKQKYPTNKNISVYPGFIRESTEDGCMMCYKSLNGKSRFDFYKYAIAQEVPFDMYPRRSLKGCMTCHNNAMIIGPNGEVYKCWNDVNQPKKIIGNIKDKQMTSATLVCQYVYDATIFNDPKCRECKLFPVCTGGCSWLRHQNLFEGKKFDYCTYLADDSVLEECLLMKALDETNIPMKAD